jgi:hypothetical protein
MLALLAIPALAESPSIEPDIPQRDVPPMVLANPSHLPAQPGVNRGPWSREVHLGRMTFKFQPVACQQNLLDAFARSQRDLYASSFFQWARQDDDSLDVPSKAPDLTFLTSWFQRHSSTVSSFSASSRKPGFFAKTLSQAFNWQSHIQITNERAPSPNGLALAHSGGSFFSKTVSHLMDLR